MEKLINFVTVIFIIALTIALFLLNNNIEIIEKFNSLQKIGLNIFFIFFLIFLIVHLFNPILPKFMCRVMGWHLEPKEIEFDGCSKNGVCPRCKNHVMQDSQGNWF